MTEQKQVTTFGPADVQISGEKCVVDTVAMTATLSAVVTVLRTNAEEIEAVGVLVNGSPSASIPTERSGSPSTPSPGQKLHTYDWSDTVECDASYTLQAVAEIVLRTTPGSAVTAPVVCDPCGP